MTGLCMLALMLLILVLVVGFLPEHFILAHLYLLGATFSIWMNKIKKWFK